MPQTRRMPRLMLIRASVLALAAGLAWGAATLAASQIEARSRDGVQQALGMAGQDWAEVTTDGLQVMLAGTAPTEAERFRAVTTAGGVVDPGRVIDLMEVASAAVIEAPPFSIEVLRNDSGIQLIGLIPAATDREALMAAVRSAVGSGEVVDLLETADYPAPDNWDRAVDFAVASLTGLARAKITIRPDQVAITAIADSPTEKARIETGLARRKPDTVALTTEISAPRPVITPFTLRFVIDEGGPRFDACSADSDLARDRILQAARETGVAGTPGCTVGLGAPSPDWAAAAVQSLAALRELGAGTITLSDGDIALLAPASVDPAAFERVAGALESNLPPGFSLAAEQTQPEVQADEGPREFTAALTDDGGLALSGRVVDERQREAVEAYARARFGSDKVQLALRADPDLPQGWAVKVIAALEVLGTLNSGQVRVKPDLVRVTGVTGNQTASDSVARILSDRMGAGAHYELQIGYDKRLDPTLGLPSGEECADRLNTVLAGSEFNFAPSKAELAGDPAATIAALGAAMKDCGDFRLEVGGHTDSQGSEGFNQSLSEGRAKAVLAALAEAGVPVGNMTARGYGESEPVASNETDSGREQNRRIEFRLVSADPAVAPDAPPVQVISGMTGEVVAADPGLPPAMLPAADADGSPAPGVATGPVAAGTPEGAGMAPAAQGEAAAVAEGAGMAAGQGEAAPVVDEAGMAPNAQVDAAAVAEGAGMAARQGEAAPVVDEAGMAAPQDGGSVGSGEMAGTDAAEGIAMAQGTETAPVADAAAQAASDGTAVAAPPAPVADDPQGAAPAGLDGGAAAQSGAAGQATAPVATGLRPVPRPGGPGDPALRATTDATSNATPAPDPTAPLEAGGLATAGDTGTPQPGMAPTPDAGGALTTGSGENGVNAALATAGMGGMAAVPEATGSQPTSAGGGGTAAALASAEIGGTSPMPETGGSQPTSAGEGGAGRSPVLPDGGGAPIASGGEGAPLPADPVAGATGDGGLGAGGGSDPAMATAPAEPLAPTAPAAAPAQGGQVGGGEGTLGAGPASRPDGGPVAAPGGLGATPGAMAPPVAEARGLAPAGLMPPPAVQAQAAPAGAPPMPGTDGGARAPLPAPDVGTQGSAPRADGAPLGTPLIGPPMLTPLAPPPAVMQAPALVGPPKGPDSFTLGGYTVLIEPAGDSTPRPRPRPTTRP